MTPTTPDLHTDGADKAAALQWLVNRLRWERLLTGLHDQADVDTPEQRLDEAA